MSDAMMSNQERLVYMANQIARNFEALGSDVSAAATGDHLLQFWDPHMKRHIIARLDEPDCALTPTAREAVRIMKQAWSAGEMSVPGIEAASAPEGASDAGLGRYGVEGTSRNPAMIRSRPGAVAAPASAAATTAR